MAGIVAITGLTLGASASPVYYTSTDFNGHSGFRTAAQGAEPSVYLATLPDDGPTGVHWGYLWTADRAGGYGVMPW